MHMSLAREYFRVRLLCIDILTGMTKSEREENSIELVKGAFKIFRSGFDDFNNEILYPQLLRFSAAIWM